MAAKHGGKRVRSSQEYGKLKNYLDRHPELQNDILRLRQAEMVASNDYPDLDSHSEMWCWRVLYLYGANQ